jgi:hypothetical protein
MAHGCSREYGFDYVELQLKFEVNLFPIYPPSLRPIKPRLAGSMLSRCVGFSPIQVQSWNPARQIEHVLQVSSPLFFFFLESRIPA